jgi:hypothetical protein
MYDAEITDKQIWEVGKQLDVKLIRYDDSLLEEMLEKLDGAVVDKDKWGFATKTRQLTPTEKAFIRNERLVCKYDFDYFFRRYCHTLIKIIGQPTVIARVANPLEPQKLFIRHLGIKEREIAERKVRNEPIDGYMFAACKARQEGYTTIARSLTMHRCLFWEDSRALAASLDETMVQELYDRDHTIYDHLPWWMKPQVEYDQKAAHFTFGKMGTSITYAQGNQKGGIGTSKTIPIAHITELGLWDVAPSTADPEQILLNLQSTWPQSDSTIVILESTSMGRGNFWHTYITASNEGRTRFFVVFCPWYAEPQHNRRQPPAGWEPSHRTKEMIATVERTSPGYLFGKVIKLDAQQSYWWESSYEEHRGIGRAAYFLTNYPTTLAESFQVSGNRAFTVEQIDAMRNGIIGGVPYKFHNTQEIGKIR